MAIEGGDIVGGGRLRGGPPEGGEEAFEDGGSGEGSAIGATAGPAQDEGLAGSGGGDVGVVQLAGGVGKGAPTEVESGFGEGFTFATVEEGGGGRGSGEDAFVEAEDEGEGDLGLAGAIDSADHDLVEGWGDDAEGEAGEAGFGDGHPIPGREGGMGEGAFDIVHPTEHFLPGGVMDGTIEGRKVVGFSLPTGEGRGDLEIGPQGAQGEGKGRAVDGGIGQGQESAEGLQGGGEEAEGIWGQGAGRQDFVQVQPGIAAEAVLEGEVFQVIHQRERSHHQTGFQCAEPIIESPATGGDTEGAAGEFGDGMMAHGFAEVGEEGDLMTAEGLGQEVAIILHASDRDADIAEAAAVLMDMAEDPPCGEAGFGGGIEAFDEMELGRKDGGGIRGGRWWERVVPMGGQAGEVGRGKVSGRRGAIGGEGAEEGGKTQGTDAMKAAEVGGPSDAPQGGLGGRGWVGRGGRVRGGGVRGFGLEAEGEGGLECSGEDGREEVHLGLGHFGKTIEPEAGEGGHRGPGGSGGRQLGSGKDEQFIRIMELLALQPCLIFGEQEGEVVDFIGQSGVVGGGREGKVSEVTETGTDAVKFAEHLTQLGGKADGTGGGPEGAKVGFMAEKEGAEHHDPALFREDMARRMPQTFQDAACQAVEGQDHQSGEAGDTGRQEAAFDLEGGLFGGDPEQGRTIGMGDEEVAHPLDAGVGFSGAGGTEEEFDGAGVGHAQVSALGRLRCRRAAVGDDGDGRARVGRARVGGQFVKG